MIVRKNLDPRIVVRVAWKRVAMLTLTAVVVVLGYHYYGNKDLAIDSLPASILGVALAILIGFRINSAYERWWEARRLWGAVVNDSRSVARQALTFITLRHAKDADDQGVADERKQFIYRQIAFVHAMKNHLRKLDPFEEIRPFLSEGEFAFARQQQHVPVAILNLHAKHLEILLEKGLIEDFRHMQIDIRLSALTDSLGGCERIKNTVFPRQYSFYTTMFVTLYSFLLPFILVGVSGWYTVPFTIVIGFIFFALDSIARGVENPFENTFNDTPMSSICRTIEINLKQMVGETELPAPVQPVNCFLY
ncbi:MAG TPA: bestrophin family ion channel [Chryseosolibacter sp.]|nr:bestrophin family ion channel [Chryseosolibacter sp.]